MDTVTVTEWKAMFADIGLSEEDMRKWHQLFEKRHPAAHQRFLAWLGLDAATIKNIRAM